MDMGSGSADAGIACVAAIELDDTGYNRMAPFEVTGEQEPRARKAARLCPERAIAVEEV